MEEKKTRKRTLHPDMSAFEEPEEMIPVTNIPPMEETEHRASVRSEKQLINCLRNERVIVRYINKASAITDKRHVLFGKMHENAEKVLVTPMLSSGTYVNVLTNDEKDFLEDILGLEPNAMSVYKKVNNFWDSSSDNALVRVTLKKQDNFLDLSKPEDYIKYKILLANKDLVAPSYEAWQDTPKASYVFYITSEVEESRKAFNSVASKSQAYFELGKMTDNISKMRLLIKLLTGRPTAKNSKAEYLQLELGKCIDANAKEFMRTLADPMLDTKAFIEDCVDAGIIFRAGDWYKLPNGTPLCEAGEEPKLSFACKFLNAPKHQDILFALQAKLKN